MTSMTSFFRFAFLALAGALLAAYAVFHEINARPGAEQLHHLLENMPLLKAAISFPPGILVGIAGLVILMIALYRLHALWNVRRLTRQRRPLPALDDRNARRTYATKEDPIDPEFDGDEYGPPGAPYGGPQRERYRDNGQYDSRWAESHR